jgi:small subunit ribosomal protein S16
LSVKIRLRRMGTKGKPFYRVVVADSRTARDGRFIETIGTYDPRTDPATVKINEEKALLWMGRGAQPTDTTRALLKKQGIVGKFLASKTPAAATPVVTEEVEEKKPAPRKKKATATVEEQPVVETTVEAPVVAEAEAAVEEQTAVETTVEEPVAAETEAAAKEQPAEEQG